MVWIDTDVFVSVGVLCLLFIWIPISSGSNLWSDPALPPSVILNLCDLYGSYEERNQLCPSMAEKCVC